MLAAAWVTAGATAGLLIGAVITAIYAAGAFNMQRNELKETQAMNAAQITFLQLQTDEIQGSIGEMRDRAAERRRAQASLIFVWQEALAADPRISEHQTWDDELTQPGPKPKPWFAVAHVRNDSDQPVYDLRISWIQDVPPKSINRGEPLKPGDHIWDSRSMPKGELPSGFGVTVFFRDAAGVIWRAHSDGRHDEMPPEQNADAREVGHAQNNPSDPSEREDN
jgi:TolA-binding protein